MTSWRPTSLLGSDERVVLDLGSRTCRAGLSGDAEPRIVLDAAQLASHGAADALWDLDWMRADSVRTLQLRHIELVRMLTRVLRHVYEAYLLIDPRSLRVLLTHSPLGVDAVQHALCQVLLSNMHVPSVSFIDTHVAATLATGRTCALVADVGYLETCVMPVFDGRPMPNYTVTTPRGGRYLARALHDLLQAFARGADITPDLVECVQTQALVVGDACDVSAATVSPLDVDAFAAAYAGLPCHADDAHIRHGTRTLHVPGWLRERACEVFWERGNEDELSVPECIAQCAARLPMDTRRTLLQSILLMGGVCLVPGWLSRCLEEVQRLTAHTALTAALLNGHATHMPPNMLAWTGLSLAGHLHADGTHAYTRDAWRA